MRLVVVSSSSKFDSELKVLSKLFDCGLETFHLRKPKFSAYRMNGYLKRFPPEHLNKVVIHSHHRLAVKYKLKGIHISEKQKKKKIFTWIKLRILQMLRPTLCVTTSFHSIADLMADKNSYPYVFLSPIFDSISKKNYRSTFTENVLSQALEKTHHTVFALGGVDAKNVLKAKQLGFAGVAVLGGVWAEGKDPVKAFTEIQSNCSEKKLTILPLNMEI